MAYGLTPEGFVAKTLEEIDASFVAQQKANIDPDLNTSPFELIGQLNGIFASALAEVWELAEAINDAMDPDKATGAQQDALYSLTNTLRLAATRSTVLATLELTPGTDINIPVGEAIVSVEGRPAIRFRNAEPIVFTFIEDSFEHSVVALFECEVTGPVRVDANTLTVIETPHDNWETVTNAQNAEIGSDIEKNVAYRVRRVLELAGPGGGTVDGLRSDLLALDTVRAAIVLDNWTDETDAAGLPPKSFEAVVRSDGGDETEIATLIWENGPAGIRPYGSELPVSVLGSDGVVHAVTFSRPAVRDVWVQLRLVTTSVYVSDAATKNALLTTLEDPTSAAFYDIGTSVYAARLVVAAMALPGVRNAEARVSFDDDDFDDMFATLDLERREIAAFAEARITIETIEVFP